MVREKIFLTFFGLLLGLTYAGEIKTFTAESCGSDIKVLKEEAISLALKKACEYGGVDIKSFTAVEDMSLQNMLLWSRCSSKVKILGIPKVELVKTSNPLQVCLKATVKTEISQTPYKDWNIRINLYGTDTDLPIYRVKNKEILRVELSTSKPCYAYVFEVSPEGYTDRLIPAGVSDSGILLRKKNSFYYQLDVFNRKYPQNWKLIFVCSLKPLKELRLVPNFETSLHLPMSKKFKLPDLEVLLFKENPALWNVDFVPFQVVGEKGTNS